MADANNTATLARRGKPPLNVVQLRPKFGAPCDETIAELEYLLDEARKGNVVGVAYAVMFKNRRSGVNITGTVRSAPTFARGMVACLDDLLRDATRDK